MCLFLLSMKNFCSNHKRHNQTKSNTCVKQNEEEKKIKFENKDLNIYIYIPYISIKVIQFTLDY